MKKLTVMFLLIGMTIAMQAQSMFKSVPLFNLPDQNNMLLKGETPITHQWVWRLDGTFALKEINRNTVTKQWVTTDFSAVGLCIGYQNYIPKSAVDPTPVNNFGAAAGLAAGRNIMNPNLAELKVLAEVNIWQYFKIGGTFTPKPPTNISKFGYYIGGGITF